MNWSEWVIEYALRSGVLMLSISLLIGIGRLFSVTAALRHTIGILGVSFVLVMPLFLFSSWRWEVLPFNKSEQQTYSTIAKVENSKASHFANNQPVVVAEYDSEMVSPEAMQGNTQVIPIVLTIWIAGTVGYMVVALVSLITLRRVRIMSHPAPPEFQEILRKQHHGRPISLIVSPRVMSPVMWGVVRPVIALPRHSVDWSDEQIRLVLLHELAHIRRNDGAVLVLRRCFLALHWFNPIAWLLCRQLEILAEEACDGRVLRNETTPAQYAELLFSMAKERQSFWVLPIAVSGRTQTLETRIRMIVKQPSKLVAQSRSVSTVAIICGISALAFSVATLAYAVEKNSSQQLEKKLEETVIPLIEFSNAPLRDAFNFIADRSRELDTVAKQPRGKGINIVMIGDLSEKKVSLKLSNIPVGEAIQLVADLADVEVQKREHVMIIRDPERSKQNVHVDSGSEALQEKLNRIIIPSVNFSNTPVQQAIDFIHHRSVELDMKSPHSAKGVNVVLKPDGNDRKVTLRLNNASLGELISITAEAAGYDVNIRKSLVYVARDLEKNN